LDLFGDRWTLLVVRDLFLGRNRFKEFASSPEGIPTNILSDRLTKLMGAGLICQTRVEEGGKRMAYKLTDKGKDLEPVLEAVRQWSLQWQPGTKVLLHQK
jgi:DNA-binding HxlR family transcriptional regulator